MSPNHHHVVHPEPAPTANAVGPPTWNRITWWAYGALSDGSRSADESLGSGTLKAHARLVASALHPKTL